MEYALELDRLLLLKINRTWTTAWADQFFPSITDLHRSPFFAVMIVLLVLGVLLLRFRQRGLVVFAWLLMTLAISDMFGGQLVKPLFNRQRPNLAGVDVVMRAPHHNGPSFTSNHAANVFCAAVFLWRFIPAAGLAFFAMAALVAYSRVYCGVHYPLDVVFGGIQGATIGFFMSLMLLRSKLNPFRGEPWPKS